jgi:DNA-binding MarR family transcriptional regulator
MEANKSIARALYGIGEAVKKLRYELAKQEDLNTSEYDLLVHIYQSEDEMSIKHSSYRLLLCSQAITKISRTLESRGFITLDKSEHDRRVTYLRLTPEGKRVAKYEEEMREQLIKLAAINLPTQDMELGASLLAALSFGVEATLKANLQPQLVLR